VNDNTTEYSDLRCTFCIEPATTKDHIPARNLFKTSPPNNLITVPACLSCNHDASKDDEWFRNYLVSDDRIRNHTESQELLNAFNRSLQRPQNTGLRETINRSLRRFPLITEGGIYYGEGTALESDFKRETRVLTRIIKGLFYHEFQRPHPDENSISVFSCKTMGQGEESLNVVLELIGYIKKENKKKIGNDVFSYGWAVAEDHPDGTFWVLTFFQTSLFSFTQCHHSSQLREKMYIHVIE